MSILSVGLARGEEIGKEDKLIEQICKKLLKGKSVEVIAEELEEEADVIRQICEVSDSYAPEYNYKKSCHGMAAGKRKKANK